MVGKNGRDESLVVEVADLFEPGDRYFVVTGACDLAGPEGLDGLYLIANCLHARFGEGADVRGDGATPVPEADGPRGRKVARALARLAARGGDGFVACYQLRGSAAWRMEWSDHLPAGQAFDEVVSAVRNMDYFLY